MKRLYRSRKNRMLGGVCGGIAEYFNIDPVIVRLVVVALFFVGGSALLAYVIALIVIPYEPFETAVGNNKEAASAAAPVQASQSPSDAVPLFLGIVLIVIGGVFLLHNLPIFDPFYGWARHIVRHFFWPSLLIVFGIFIIARGWKK
ncbi:MAG: PspC domain-containing protein [Candidatus Aminicenantes bacterium]|nr:PspC domain-containing protein [Acidobacteriota bacterium]MCG2809847.1 PspC domain-containing protein [Candidatus Aminicenantes bacterium]